MIEMTDLAKQKLDDYMRRLRTSLRGQRSIDAEEVEQNVREHIDVALTGGTTPVAAEHLDAVLLTLGPPERWLGEEDRAWWRVAMKRVSKGPEDWRLAYLAFGAFFLMLLFFPVGGVLLLPAAYVLSRAVVELTSETHETLGARRWLVYPAIVMVLLFAIFIVIVLPVIGATALMTEQLPGWQSMTGLHQGGLVLTVAGFWWITASMLMTMFIRPIRFVFAPLLDRLQRRHTAVLALVGLIVAAGGAAMFAI